MPRNRAFGAHNWNAHRSTPNKHVKREWCETIGKCLIKWFELWSIWGPKWPGNWASVANIQHTSKSSRNWHVHQDWCATSGKFLRKWPKTGILTSLGAQSGPKIGPLRPIFSTHLKVIGMSMWSNTVVKPVKTFWESDQTPEIFLTLGPKMAQKLGLWGPYFTPLWK